MSNCSHRLGYLLFSKLNTSSTLNGSEWLAVTSKLQTRFINSSISWQITSCRCWTSVDCLPSTFTLISCLAYFLPWIWKYGGDMFFQNIDLTFNLQDSSNFRNPPCLVYLQCKTLTKINMSCHLLTLLSYFQHPTNSSLYVIIKILNKRIFFDTSLVSVNVSRLAAFKWLNKGPVDFSNLLQCSWAKLPDTALYINIHVQSPQWLWFISRSA
jgi:hypothetical protein